MSKLRALALGAAGALAGLLVAGCGSSTTTPAGSPATSSPAASSAATPTAAASPDTSPHNDQDVTFASDMIPHHQQAIMMAYMVPATAPTRSYVSWPPASSSSNSPRST